MTQTSEYEHVANGTIIPLGGGPESSANPTGPRLPRHLVWLDLPEEAYPGFKVKVWSNYPRSLNDELRSGDVERTKAALLKVVLEHNDWCDADGEPLPPATAAAFWDAIPDELAGAIIILTQVAAGKLASSLATRNGR